MGKMDKLREYAEKELQKAKENGHIPVNISELVHELQVHQVELQMQNEKLRKSQEKVSNLYFQYHELYNNAPVGYFTLDKDGIIRNVNINGAKLLKLNKEDIIGGSFSRFIPINVENKYYQGLANAIDAHEAQSVELQLNGNDILLDVSMEIMPIYDKPDEKYRVTITDITERKKAEEAIKESEEKYRYIVQFAPTGIYEIDYKTPKFKSVNDAMTQILGYSREELLDMNPFDFLSNEGKILFQERIQKILNNEKIDESVDFKVRTREGHELWVILNITLIYRDGKVDGALVIAHDITGRKQMENELKQARDNLEEQVLERTKELEIVNKELGVSNEELQQFAYVISHDLQEPLRTIASFTQLLERRYKGQLDKDTDEFIDYIIEASVRMKQMIHDLLEYSRVGTHGKEFHPVDMEELLGKVLVTLHDLIERNQAEITHDPLPIVISQKDQLDRVFQNLIGNAIKFRKPNEPPKVHISARKEKDEYVFSVTDNGIGIEKEYFDHIFIIFQRLHTMDEYQGTGIGLSTVKRIVERHGGGMWVKSEPGEGSTFYFTLPIDESKKKN